jgi:L-lactate dehydrogenase complex protein LldG
MNDAREAMLGRIRQGLANNRAFLEREALAAPHTPPPFVHPAGDDDLAERFAAELRKLAAHAHLCADRDAARAALCDILVAAEVRRALSWALPAIELPGLADDLMRIGVERHDVSIAPTAAERTAHLHELEPATACISGVDALIAESATIVLLSGQGRPRLASLLAPCYIAIARRDQIVRGLGQAIARLQQHAAPDLFADHSSLTFITGPSRTADIEMTLALGVHGPRDVHVIIYG